MRYLLTFSYDGSLFHGFQRQKGIKNVQSTLENALSKYLNASITVKGSGRTDAFVHATSQCAHFDTDYKLSVTDKRRINNMLDGEIVLKSLKKVPDTFHARFSVKNKTYCYVINTLKTKRNDNYYFTSLFKLDLKKMQEASKLFIGTHDFQNFVSGKRDDYITYIDKIKIYRKNNLIIFKFQGSGFYRYMVRHLVGALYDVGRGKVSQDIIKYMLDNPHIHKQLTVMIPNGLYLVKVKY